MKKSIILSIIITIICFTIVIFRIGYPYHRWLAITLYVLSWVLFVFPLIKTMRRHSKFVKYTAGLLVLFFFSYLLYVIFPLDNYDLAKADEKMLEEMIQEDRELAEYTIKSLDSSVKYLISDLDSSFDNATQDSNQVMKQKFERVVDHILILDELVERYRYFYQINHIKNGQLHEDAFLIMYASLIAKAKAVQMISGTASEHSQTILNEELIIGKDTLLKLEKSFIDPDTAIGLNAGFAYLNLINADGFLAEYSRESYIDMSKELPDTTEISIDSALKIFEDRTMTAWLPIQKKIANTLGETKIPRRDEYLITFDQIEQVHGMLEPGDINFQRRNWYVSNAGMPGFWTHAAIYVGYPDELEEYFSDIEPDLIDKLEYEYPEVYEELRRGHVTIEAKAPGIVMLPLNVSLHADYIAYVRPKASKQEKLDALFYAFDNYGKKYDFNFDFTTDDELVCSELVYKAYPYLNYTPQHLAGRLMFAPNDMVRDLGDQAEFIVFLDGNENAGTAEFSREEEFRKSCERSKYEEMLA